MVTCIGGWLRLGLVLVTLVVASSGCLDSRLLWDGTMPPTIVDVKGSQAVLGIIRVGGDDQLYLAAYDGEQLHELWRAGPLGSYEEGYQATRFVTVGDRIAITDFRGVVRVLDMADGHEIGHVQLPDRVAGICVDASMHSVWFGVQGGATVLVDLERGTSSTPDGSPTGCAPPPAYPEGAVSEDPPVLSTATTTPFSPYGATFADGDDGVVLGMGAFGSPTAVGFDRATGAVRWQTPLAQGDAASSGGTGAAALAGGAFVVTYSMKTSSFPEWHMTELDPHSGKRKWDIVLSTDPGELLETWIMLTSSRVFLGDGAALVAFDARTGDERGSVGIW